MHRANAPSRLSTRHPLLWAALAYSCGLWAGRYFWRPPGWWVIASLAFCAFAICFLRRRVLAAFVLTLGALAMVAALTIQIRGARSETSQWLGDGQPVIVTAHVIADGNLREDAPGSWRQRVDVETEGIELDGNPRASRVGVRLTLRSQTGVTNYGQPTTDGGVRGDPAPAEDAPEDKVAPMTLLRYGQRIRFGATLNSPRNFRNPGAFDYAGYLQEKGILAMASAKYPTVEVLPGFAGSRILLWRARVHRGLLNQIHALWPERLAGLMDAIIIGEESFIDRPERVDFQRSGTYHVLVVSGMNVSILAMFTLWSLRRIGLSEVVASAAAIALIVAYAFLTDVGPPVWRAALMFAVYLATRLLYRDRAMLNGLGAAALALLVFDPNALFGASFQMTFLCVILVAGVGLPIIERTIGPFSRGLRNLNALALDRALPPRVAQFRIDLRLVLSRARRQRIVPRRIFQVLLLGGLRITFGFLELVIISAIMQVGLAMHMAWFFHRATSVAMPANLLVIPFLQLLMPAAVLAIFTGYISLALAKIPAAIAAVALQGITGTVGWLGGMRIADVRVATPGVIVMAAAGITILLCVLVMRRHRWLSASGLAALSFSALWIWTVPPKPQLRSGVLEMTAIDVGQGDSLLLVLPDGHKLLVDAGGLPFWTHSQLDIGEDVVSPYLWTRGISRLDAIALTHAHADHMGGMPAIIANFRPRELWLPEGIPEEEIRHLLDVARVYEVAIVYRKAGEAFVYGGADIRVLAPNGDLTTASIVKSGSRRNDESLVLRVAYGNTSALLEADAEKPTERFLTTEEPAADVLKVAHHGSASSTNYSLLAAVRPRFAVISVGARNVYHHPRHEVLERLQQARVITFRTDEDGATSFFLDGKTVTSELAGVGQSFTYESVSPSTSGDSSAAASNSASSAISSAGVRR